MKNSWAELALTQITKLITMRPSPLKFEPSQKKSKPNLGANI